ncbi:MAG: PKD domain-containing protein, partial [Chloroflexi bacterium]|nr:PKD domain-containing protein [Chloroflexota bacterium]
GQTGIVNFHPDTPLQPDTTYQIEILAGGVKDVVGNTVGTTFTAQFSTGSSLANPPACTINPTTPSEVNSVATFSTSLLQGSNVTYSYDFGDGSTSTPFVTDNTATHTYTQTGHFPIQVTVTDGLNSSSCAALQIIYNPVTAVPPTASSTIILDQDGSKVWNVNPDNGTVTAVSTTDYAKVWETAVGTHPRTLAQAANGDIWVTNQDDASISILDSSTGAVIHTITLPYASQPYAIVFSPDGSSAFVTLQATGQLIAIDPTTLAITGTLDVGATPRGIAITNDSSSLFVTRFISPDTHGEVTEIDLATFTATRIIELAFDPGPDTESSARGVPNGLGSPTISPDGLRLWIPSKKDNIARGLYRDGLGLTFETTVRTITSQIDLSSNSEVLSGRHDYDNRDRAIAVAFSALGDYAFVALQGSNAVEVVDTTSGNLITAIEGIGLAPQGLTFSQDGNTLFVHSFLSRSVLAYDVSEIVTAGSQTAVQLANTITVATEQFTPDVLLGKQIFYNAADNRMNQEGYLACASCHLDDGGDGRIWDRGADGEGFRNTISLIGVGGMEQGRVHFSANFDEIQDFEHDMRQLFGGTGFLTDAQFNSNNTNHPLGDAKAGLNAELDALATYVASLNQFPLSPYRNSNGTLTADAEAGKLLFASLDCATCHSGTHFTDSPSGIRHDVGTILSTSGQRLTLPLLGFDTPTLRNLWQTAPYLHDGSAPTLDEVLTTRNPDDLHGETAVLTQTERDQLVAYLLQIDRLEPAQPDSTPAILLTAPLHNATFATNVVIDLETAVTTTLGTISSVEFYADSTLIGTDSTAPYTFTWSSAEVGQHFLIARAIHDNGNRTISNELRLLIEDGVPTPTPLPTATPTTIPSGGTLFSDDFNRANSTIVGNGWLEIEDSGTAVDILDNQLCFTESSNEPNSPIVTHSFAPTTSGELTFSFDFDWQRTGTDRAYRVFMQLGDGSLMNENSWDDGVGVNVLWSAISRVHETLGYRQGGSNHSLTTVSGTAHIEITANLDTNTFDITVDGTLVGTSLPFDNLVAFDTVRFFSDRMLDSDFAGRCFDNVSITQPGAPVPTATATFTAVPTSTATPLPTNTTTPAATSTPLPTATTTAVPTSTATPAATNTPTIIPTSTVTAVSTSTPTPAPTTTSTPIPTNTPTPLPTNTPMPTPTDTPGGNSMHVADIDGLAISLGSRWDAIMTVTIVDDTGQAMAGAMVTGTFAFNGRSRTYSCDTEPNGICDIQLTGLKNNITSVTFTIDNVVGTLPYLSSNNTDPDGDSDGTTFTLPRP